MVYNEEKPTERIQMTHLTRIARYGDKNPFPIPETVHLTLEQRCEYTFIMTLDNGDSLLIPETDARIASPLIEHMVVGNVFLILK